MEELLVVDRCEDVSDVSIALLGVLRCVELARLPGVRLLHVPETVVVLLLLTFDFQPLQFVFGFLITIRFGHYF